MMFLAKNGGGGGSNSNSGGGGGGGFMGLFGGGDNKGKKDPLDLAKQWKRDLQKEIRRMDRDIADIKRSEQRSITECKALAKKGRMSAVKILAKEVANTRRTVERMYTAKAQLNSVSSTLTTSMSMLKMQGCMTKSAEIMTAMNQLVNIKEIRETMQTMAREMERAGLVEEIIGETMESMEPEGLDAEADAEADRIIAEITGEALGSSATVAPVKAVKGQAAAAAGPVAMDEPEPEEAEAEGESTQDLMSRLQAL